MKQIILSIEVEEISVRAIHKWLDSIRLNNLSNSGIDIKHVYIADDKGDLKDALEREGLEII